jgi:hypothetical protein
MKLPRGRLCRSRVVDDIGTPLSTVLDRELTGYARLESHDTLLLDADGVGVLTFEDGVPVVAYHTGTDSGGVSALADIAVAGPYRVELYELDHETLAEVHEADELLVPPGLPAEQLAADDTLAERTREHAPEGRTGADAEDSGLDAVESFLEDEAAIESIRERARAEAETRADEWGFDVATERGP